MQRLTIVRYTVKPEAIGENEALCKAVFDEARAKQPKDVAYALFRKGGEFIHVFMNFAEDDSEAITGLPSFKSFGKDLPSRCLIEPKPERLSVEAVERYGFNAS